MRPALTLVLLLSAIAGCQGQGGQADAGPIDGLEEEPADGGDAGGLSDGQQGDGAIHGWVEIVELRQQLYEWGIVRGYFGLDRHFIRYPEHRLDLRCEAQDSRDACVLYTSCAPFDRMCEDVCSPDQECVGGVCRPFSSPVDIGPIAVEGLPSDTTLEQDEYGWYGAGETASELFDQGDPIRVQAEPAALEPFELAATGVAAMEMPYSSVEPQAGQPLVFDWTPGSLAEARVQVLLLSGWHAPYAPEVALLCEVEDSAGQLVIPAELVDGFLARASLFNRPGHIMRYTSDQRSWQGGEVQLWVGSAWTLHTLGSR
ncbi:MAG: hypothetical protein JXR96_05485 [Deltaproteobacteria bacterium]|nr:hypothetical protein [Deltaproteobacteria bacterium]